MRASISLLPLLLVGCFNVRVTRGLPVNVSVRANVRADVHVQAAPQPAVALQGAPVVEFFGIPLEGAQDVVFVLDVSGSMNDAAQGRLAQIQTQPTTPPPPPPADPNAPPADPNAPPADPNAPAPATAPPPTSAPKKIDVAQAELVEALQRLPVGTRMNVVFFDSDIDAFSAEMVTLDETTRATTIHFVQYTQAGGSTALAPAMRAALLMNAHRVVLLSDGLGNVGGGPDDVLRDAREAIHGGVRIDTIGLGSGQDAALLGALASESGGLYQAL